MIDIFFSAFRAMIEPVLQILIIAFIGGLLVRLGYLQDEWTKGLASLLVNVFTPALIFTKILKGFKPDEFTFWWMLPLGVMLVMLFALGIARLAFWRAGKSKKSLWALSAFHNANYLVLPIGLFAYPDQFDEFASYVFLVVLGVSPMVWSIGKFLVSPENEDKSVSWKAFISPPFFANLLGLVLVLLGWRHLIPEVIFKPVEMLGTAAVPGGTFVLGATLGSISMRSLPPFWDAFRIMFIKFFCVPASILWLLWEMGLFYDNQLLAELIMIQAASAPAASLLISVRRYGGNVQEISGHLLLSYILVLLVIPFWLACLRTLHA